MRVDFDSQIFSVQTFGGISRYFANLAKQMDGLPDVRARIIAPFHVNEYLLDVPKGIVKGFGVGASQRSKLKWRGAGLAAGAVLQAASRADVLHKTYYYPVPALAGRAKTVLTVYDMIHEKFPESFSVRNSIAAWKKKAIAKADQIICISEQTRRDLLEFNPDINTEKLAVTYLGFDALDQLLVDEPPTAFRRRTFGIDKPYILFVGARAGYKNFPSLLAAYQASAWLRDHFNLLCFGGGSFSDSERIRMVGSGTASQIFHIGGSDDVLACCYQHAALFVYPSLYEGFGIPPLEAMSMDCPVACSDTSSIPEVVGDAAAYFEPSDIDQIRTVLENTLNSQTVLASLVEAGRARRAQFSWRRCAEETVDVYRKVLAR